MHTPKPYHCRHIFTDGHQCGSPALHGEPLCFYHHAARRPDQLRTIAGDAQLAFPEPLDLHAIQRGLAQLLRLTAAGHIEDRQSRTLLRILATASANLARIDRQTAAALKANPARTPVQDYTLDDQRGTLAPAPADQPAPAPRPEGPLPDPIVKLNLKPNLEIVRDPLLEEFKQLQTQKRYREAEAALAANAAARAARPQHEKDAERQAARNRLPAAWHPIFDEQNPTPAALEPQPQPKQNQDFGLLENSPEEHFAHQ